MGHENEDFDAILADIMHGGQPPKPVQAHPQSRRVPARNRPTSQPRPQTIGASGSIPFSPSHTTNLVKGPTGRRKRTWRLKPGFMYAGFTLVILLIAGFLFYFVATAPKNPFTGEMAEEIDYPLLYPATLPEGFKLDKNSVSQTEDVVIYAIKNGDKTIHISLQPQPQNFNLKPVLDLMTDVRQIETPAGETYSGVTKDNRLLSHTVTGSVWIITNMPKDTVDNQELDAMLQSFREG